MKSQETADTTNSAWMPTRKIGFRQRSRNSPTPFDRNIHNRFSVLALR